MHDCRLGFAPLANLIADADPAPVRAKPPALVRRVATEFKDGPSRLTDLSHGSVAKTYVQVDGGWMPKSTGGASGVGATGGIVKAAPHKVGQQHAEHIISRAAFDKLYPPSATIRVSAGPTREEVMGAVAAVAASYPPPTKSTTIKDLLATTFDPLYENTPRTTKLTFPVIEPATTQAAAEPEWIEWKGGECPVAKGVHYQVWFRADAAGHDSVGSDAPSLDWSHSGTYAGGGDIVAYRVLP